MLTALCIVRNDYKHVRSLFTNDGLAHDGAHMGRRVSDLRDQYAFIAHKQAVLCIMR